MPRIQLGKERMFAGRGPASESPAGQLADPAIFGPHLWTACRYKPTMLKKVALMALVYSLVGASAALSGAKSIADESLRMDALRTVFPKATIFLLAGGSIDDSWSPPGHSKEFLFPGALVAQ